jgi:hypothetical protein
VHDVLVLLSIALDVAHVPSEGFEKGIDELNADAGFFVVWAGVDVQVAFEALDQLYGFWGYCHVVFPS